MPIEVKMPRLSDTMEVGTIVKWSVKEGQDVGSGDVIADIETDKATMELQSFDEGKIAALTVKEGESVPVGTVIALLAEPGEDVEAVKKSGASAAPARQSQKAAGGEGRTDDRAGGPPPGPRAVEATAESEESGTATPTPSPERAAASAQRAVPSAAATDTNGRVFASPLARKIAQEHNLDLSRIRGSGPSGRIVRKDVEGVLAGGGAQASPAAAAPAQSPTPAPLPPVGAALESRTVQLSNMRRTIAKRLVESKTTIPHYQVTVTARLDALQALRAQLNEQLAAQGVRLSVNDFLVRACALAMHRHPFINSRWGEKDGASIELIASVNIGVAIALSEEKGGGLVVATIRNADQIGLRQISAQTRAYAEKARTKGLSIEDMSDSTFTISNLGMYGVDHFTAIINPPNAAILAVGAAMERPVVETAADGSKRLGIGSEMSMTMSSDHRIIDGAMAAEYLATVKDLLEKPATLLV